jgi:hypothetical protein
VVADSVQHVAHLTQHPFGLIHRMTLAPQAGNEFLLFTDARFLRQMARSLTLLN